MAYAQIRGGGDLGKPWHDAGRMMKKMNTFTDFIDSTEYLVANKYGSREKAAIEGGSAGGMLIGALSKLGPALFQDVITSLPFVCGMDTLLNTSLPPSFGDNEDWANTNKK